MDRRASILRVFFAAWLAVTSSAASSEIAAAPPADASHAAFFDDFTGE